VMGGIERVMPKTTMHAGMYNPTGSTPNDPDFMIVVGWNKYGGVQLATVYPAGGLVDSDGKNLDVVEPGWFCDLDRTGINNLIRELRKARDTAFGRDE